MIADILQRLRSPAPLSAATARAIFDRLIDPGAGEPERVALLLALTLRPETSGDLARLAAEMRRRSVRFPVPRRDAAIDLCGSGGAPRPSYNVSTVSAFVVAAAGAAVVKHGNRSARGPCGSTDLLEALGLPVATSIPFARATYARHRLAFLHAPLFHPATDTVAIARRTLGIPTIFNRLGPLVNPARVPCQVVGVAGPRSLHVIASALRELGFHRGLTMTSPEGCDEFSPKAPTSTIVWDATTMRRRTVDPTQHLDTDERRGSWDALPPRFAADEAERLLAGGGGARRGSVLLTAGAALWVGARAPSFSEGVDRAREALDGGGAETLLQQLRATGTKFAPRRR